MNNVTASDSDLMFHPDPGRPPIRHLRVGGVRVAPVSRRDLWDLILADARARRADPDKRSTTRLLFDSNGHALSLAARDPAYKDALEQADVVHADGKAIAVAANALTSKGIPERTATTDLIYDLAAAADPQELSYYLLGGEPGLSGHAAEVLQGMYPHLRIAGFHHGYFSLSEEEGICAEINACNPDVLWVGMGKPKEQLFCVRNRERLDVPWAISCGGLFRFVTGVYVRAPKWMQDAGLEWLYRLYKNPRHLFWRYATTNPHAIFLMLTRTSRGYVD